MDDKSLEPKMKRELALCLVGQRRGVCKATQLQPVLVHPTWFIPCGHCISPLIPFRTPFDVDPLISVHMANPCARWKTFSRCSTSCSRPLKASMLSLFFLKDHVWALVILPASAFMVSGSAILLQVLKMLPLLRLLRRCGTLTCMYIPGGQRSKSCLAGSFSTNSILIRFAGTSFLHPCCC